MKHGRKRKTQWYIPPESPALATFSCRACGVKITKLLRRLKHVADLASKELKPLVPEDAYWIVTDVHLPTRFDGKPVDFAGCYAVHPDSLAGVGKHPDPERWIGCCGPSGTGGLNRICICGRPVGTERSDCLCPVAIYLDPTAVRPAETEKTMRPQFMVVACCALILISGCATDIASMPLWELEAKLKATLSLKGGISCCPTGGRLCGDGTGIRRNELHNNR
jgi:hypothetical protein